MFHKRCPLSTGLGAPNFHLDLVPLLGISKNGEGFDLAELMEFLSKPYNSANGEVRAMAITVTKEIFDLVGPGPIRCALVCMQIRLGVMSPFFERFALPASWHAKLHCTLSFTAHSTQLHLGTHPHTQDGHPSALEPVIPESMVQPGT
eukprot:640661-Pelagomonas_calceolata.AAC.5